MYHAFQKDKQQLQQHDSWLCVGVSVGVLSLDKTSGVKL